MLQTCMLGIVLFFDVAILLYFHCNYLSYLQYPNEFLKNISLPDIKIIDDHL